MKNLFTLSQGVLVLAGLLWAYEGIMGSDLIETVFGSLEPTVDVVVFGGAAVIVGYHLLNKKK